MTTKFSNEKEVPIFIAETGASHEHSYAKAIALIDAARWAGADAVKFSAFKPDQMTVNSEEPPFIISQGSWKGRNLYSLYEQSTLPYEWIPDLRRATLASGMDFILSIYHPDTVPLAVEWGCSTVKIASFELAWLELIDAVARSRIKHVILSTGSATLEEIRTTLNLLKDKQVVLLHCVSAYPTVPEDMNLKTMMDMHEQFNQPVGLSDHSTGLVAPAAATALGAMMIEKHIELDDNGLDASFAVMPDQFKAMVEVCKQIKVSIGEVKYDRPKTYHRKLINGQQVRVVW